jgi:hypothetical protein
VKRVLIYPYDGSSGEGPGLSTYHYGWTPLNGDLIPRDLADPTLDVLGNPLQHSGIAPRDAQLINSPCLTFNGTNQSILLNTPIADASTSHTWTAWVKVVDDTSDQYLFDKQGGTRTILNLQYNSGSDNIAIYSGVSWDEFAVGVNDDTWHHVAFKIDGSTAEIFVDGVSGGSVTITTTSIDGSTQTIASRYNQANPFVEGGLCDFRVYNTALSDTDIAAIYAGEEIDSDPIFWMPMSEGDGSSVFDVSGNGNHGTITNYASTMWDNTQSDFHDMTNRGCTYVSQFPGGVHSQQVALADPSEFTFGDGSTSNPFTISMWYKPTSTTGVSRKLFSKNYGGTSGVEWNLYNSAGNIYFQVYDYDASNSKGRYGSFGSTYHNRWNHIVAKFNGTTGTSIYVNGVRVDVANWQAGTFIAIHNTDSEIRIGNTSTSPSGEIHSACILNEDIDAGILPDWYANPSLIGPDDSRVLLWWSLDDGDGTVAADSGPYGLDGTIYNPDDDLWNGNPIPANAYGNLSINAPANTLNTNLTDINFIPEPDAPWIRSCIPGAAFDGIGDYASLGSRLTSGALTNLDITAVVKMNSTGLHQIAGEYDFSAGDRAWLLYLESGTVKMVVSRDGTATTGSAKIYQSAVLNDGQFYTIRVLFTPNSLRMFIDGSEITPTKVWDATVNSIHDTSGYLMVGAVGLPGSLGSDPYDGTIQSFEMVAPEKIRWVFTKNNGFTVVDETGNGNDGTLTVNSSLASIYAYVTPASDYTLGDGRDRPHYVTEETNFEHEFRTEL